MILPKLFKSSKRWPSVLVMGYMILALGWWSILLYRNTTQVYHLKTELLQSEMGEAYNQSPEYQEFTSEHRRRKLMVIGEGLVFILILGVGLLLINRAYYKEIEIAYQKRNFLLSITHELKSPLAGIKLAFETMRKHHLDDSIKNDLIDSALEENARLNKLVNNLLYAARVDAENPFEREVLPLDDILMEVTENYKRKYPGYSFRLKTSTVDSIYFDREGFYSIINNLLENAVKYSPDPGEIVIETDKEEKYSIIRVKDHGIGIPAKEIDKIFERFYRIGSEETRKTKGTGLGLYIVKRILEAHQGKIYCSPNTPNGSIFTVKVPVKV